jgi:nitrite reductase/ring-hydroxylating ferredoxin subunit
MAPACGDAARPATLPPLREETTPRRDAGRDGPEGSPPGDGSSDATDVSAALSDVGDAGMNDGSPDLGPDSLAPEDGAGDAPDGPREDAGPEDAPATPGALDALDAPEAADAADALAAEDAPPGDASPCPEDAVELGPVEGFPAGSWSLVVAARTVVGRDARGLFAFTAVCTHSGCVVDSPAADGTSTCPCHGSRFDGQGSVLRGPAKAPLGHLALILCGRTLYVRPRVPVSRETRLAV